MDIPQWKHVLFDWIKASELIDVFGTIEHVPVDEYFNKFYRKIHSALTAVAEQISIVDFLKEFYPDYEILYDETNNVSTQDFVYIFSLLLHYSCVREKSHHFQVSCTKLTSHYQQIIVKFLEYLDKQKNFTKEILRSGIKQSSQIELSSPEIKYFNTSPTKTPRKSHVSPPTPNKDYIFSKLNELKTIKTQLENERYERNMLEGEVKQSKEKIENLVRKCKDLSHEVQTLKAQKDLTASDTENTLPSCDQRDSHIRNKMNKEIQLREDRITDLKTEIENAHSSNQKYQLKISTLEKEMNEMRLKMLELDASIENLECNLSIKDETICLLEKERKEMMEIINESRTAAVRNDSSEFLELSGSTTLYTTTCNISGESLGRSLMDIQLKERDTEVVKLRELLDAESQERAKMESKITELQNALKSTENELNETKISNTKLFEAKSTEIQILQNELNSSVSKNKELQREVELKHQINIKFLSRSDSQENDKKTLQTEVDDLTCKLQSLREEKEKYAEDLEKAQCEIKSLLENQSNENILKQQILDLRKSLEELSSNASQFEERIQQQTDDFNTKLKAKEDKISTLEELINTWKLKHENEIKESELRLSVKSNELEQLNLRYSELEKKFLREEGYSKRLCDDNEILKAKLMKERSEIQKLKDDKIQFEAEMKEKFESLKMQLIDKYKQTIAESKGSEEQEKSFKNVLITTLQTENSTLLLSVNEKDKIIKNLTLDLEAEKREKQFLNSKLLFAQRSDDDFSRLEEVSQDPNILSERFDEKCREQLKIGGGFDNCFSAQLQSSVLKERNSKYLPHMRDSYAIGEMDRNLSELEMKGKSGKYFNNENEDPSPGKKQKTGTVYHRPGPSTPSKRGRARLSSNSFKTFKEITNMEHGSKRSTPISKIINLFGKSKSEDSNKSPNEKLTRKGISFDAN